MSDWRVHAFLFNLDSYELHLTARYNLGCRRAAIGAAETIMSAWCLYLVTGRAHHGQGYLFNLKNGAVTPGSPRCRGEAEIQRAQQSRYNAQSNIYPGDSIGVFSLCVF